MLWLCYGYGTLRHNNLDVNVPYETIMRMSILPDYVLSGEEARFPIFGGKRLYPGDPRAFQKRAREAQNEMEAHFSCHAVASWNFFGVQTQTLNRR